MVRAAPRRAFVSASASSAVRLALLVVCCVAAVLVVRQLAACTSRISDLVRALPPSRSHVQHDCGAAQCCLRVRERARLLCAQRAQVRGAVCHWCWPNSRAPTDRSIARRRTRAARSHCSLLRVRTAVGTAWRSGRPSTCLTGMLAQQQTGRAATAAWARTNRSNPGLRVSLCRNAATCAQQGSAPFPTLASRLVLSGAAGPVPGPRARRARTRALAIHRRSLCDPPRTRQASAQRLRPVCATGICT